MDDLVKELRSLADCDARAGEPLGKAMRKAADTIEALQAENKQLRAVLTHNFDAAFERVWALVKDWDISTEPGECRLYEGINGDHVRAIVSAALTDPAAQEGQTR